MRNPWKKASSISPQIDDGFCRIENSVFDALLRADLTKAECKVCLCIIRLTWGWNKTEDSISTSQLQQETGLSERSVKYAIKSLKEKRVIYYEPSQTVHRGSPINCFLFNKFHDTWIVDGVQNRVDGDGVQKRAGADKGAKVSKEGCKNELERVQDSVGKGARRGRITSTSPSVNAGNSSPKDILPNTNTKDTITKDSLSEKSNHQAVIDYWCRKYEEFYGVKYDFKGGKDGQIIKRLLRVYGYEKLIQLIDALFESKDPFYETGGGRTVGVLSANSNKLAQQISKKNSTLSRFSDKTQRSIANINQALEEMEAEHAK